MCDKGELELQVLSLKLSVFNVSLFSVTHPENACLSSHRTESGPAATASSHSGDSR